MHQHLSTDEIKNFQQLASAALASCPQVPVIAIDLDYTVSKYFKNHECGQI